MSGNYYKKVKTPPPPNSYGFKQISSNKEMNDIVQRVSRPTYSATLQTKEQRQLNNYEHLLSESGRRSVASACGRRTGASSRISSATTTDSNGTAMKSRRVLDKWTLDRLNARLSRPTTATRMKEADGKYSEITYDTERRSFYDKIGNNLPPADPKTINKLRRPTTATLAKDVNMCHLCYDHENKKKKEELDAFDFVYGDDKVVPAEEVDFIVSRIAAPTFASNKGNYHCARRPVTIDEVKIREDLPLLSGLRRSRNVKEITNRLYPSRKHHHGFNPHATAITTYG